MKLKKLRNNKSGFTLLEIIVVLIIVGVLAALAIPKLFGAIKRNEAQEALNEFSVTRQAMSRCGLKNNDSVATCNYATPLDISDPQTDAQRHFNYTLLNTLCAGGGVPATDYCITAINCDPVTHAATGSGQVQMQVTAGAVTITGTNAFLGI